MDFLKKTSRSNDTRKKNSHRSLQLESLETREMLAVSILSAPLSAYASSSGKAEIQFELKTTNNGLTKIDFVAQSGGSLDPSKLILQNRTTGTTIALSSVYDGTSSSKGSAYLATGSYSIFVGADGGSQGTFTLDILHDNSLQSAANNSLLILVEAALAQQESGWDKRISRYNELLKPYYGDNALKYGVDVKTLFPEVDINRDGVVNVADYNLALQVVSAGIATPVLTTTPTVVSQDKIGPTITAGLKNDTGTIGDLITIDTTITGRVTDASGVKSASWKLDNGSWAALTLDANGYYTIPNRTVSAGTHTVTITATDNVGNISTTTTTFVYPSSSNPAGSSGAVSDSGSGKVSLGTGFTAQTINGSSVAAGQTLTLSDNRGTVKVNADGSLAFTAGSYYDKLAQGEKGTQSITVVSKDEHGRQYTSTITFEITGKNDLPLLNVATVPSKTIGEGSYGTIAAATILANWKDVDNGAVLGVVSPSIKSVSCTNSSLASTYTAAGLAKYLTMDSGGVKFDASADLFKALGLGETLTITVSYKVSDGIGTSTDSGTLIFTITGKDDPSVLSATATTFNLPSNDLKTPVKPISPGFSVTDPDKKDASGKFTYSIKSVSNTTTGLITGFNSGNGTFNVDTSKLSNRNTASVLTVVVSVTSASGGVVDKTLTINLNPLAAPAAATPSLTTTEVANVSHKVTPTVAGNAYSISGLVLSSGTLPSGVKLSDIATIDSNGNFSFKPGTYFEHLKAGEKLSLEFQYTINDSQYGLTGTGTIKLSIDGLATKATAPANGTIGAGGKYNVTENSGNAAAMTVTKNDLLTGWTLPDGIASYTVVAGTVKLSTWSGGSTNPLSSGNFGTAKVNTDGSLTFAPSAGIYQSLGKDEWIDIAVDYSVSGGTAVTGGTVLFRIYGKDDPSVLTATTTNFTFPSNDLKTPIKPISPGFSVTDPDKKDSTGTFTYSIKSVSNTTTGLITGFNSGNGTFNVDTAKLSNRNTASVLTVVVSVTSASGGVVDKTLTINLNPLALPTATDTITVAETEKIVNQGIKAVVAGSGYTTSSFTLTSGTLPTGATATLGADGKFNFDPGKAFENLRTGESATLTFEYTITDSQYDLTGTGTITLTVEGRSTAATAPSPTDGVKNGGSSTESKGTAPEITAPKSVLLSGWTLPEGIDVYSIVAGSVRFAQWSGNAAYAADANPLDSNGFGTVSIDSQGNLVFTPAAGIYQKLGEGQWIDVVVDFSVKNVDGGSSVSGGSAVFRINGANDTPTIVATNSTFRIPSNPLGDITLRPEFTPFDIDMNNVSFTYVIDGAATDAGFRLSEDGQTLSITKDAVGLLADGDYSITVTVVDTHTGTAFDTLTITVYKESNPEVEDVLITIGEKESKSYDLNNAVTKKDGHDYRIGDITYKGSSIDLSGFDLSALFDFDGDTFAFTPGDTFAWLSAGDTLELTFEFTVYNTGFSDCMTTKQITVRIAGENDAPTSIAGDPLRTKASQANALDWKRFFGDIDARDVLSISKIDGKSFDAEGKVTIDGLGVFQYDNTSGTLTFTPHSGFDGLRAGELATGLSSISLTVVDGNGGEVTGSVGIEIEGTNKAPVAGDKTFSTEAGTRLDISLEKDGLVNDVNEGDTHTIASVTVGNKTILAIDDDKTILLDTGTKITLSDDLKTVTVDASGRTSHPADGKPETIVIDYVVTDDLDESNAGTLTVTVDVAAPKVSPVVLDSVLENDDTAPNAVDLADHISDANIPFRPNADDWYAVSNFKITGKIGNDELTDYEAISGFWSFNELTGILSFNAPEGYFDFLADGETLTLVFTYTVTDKTLTDKDGTPFSSEGTITLSITGVNNDPVITTETTYKLTNSLLPGNNTISLGKFDFSDVDQRDGEEYTWSIGNASCPDAVSVDKDGKITLDNTKLPVLAPGDTAELTFELTVTDGHGGTATETITVTLYGKQNPVVAVDDMDFDEGESYVSKPISVADPEEDFMDRRDGNAWYDEPEIVSIDVEGTKHELKFGEGGIDLGGFFKIVGDAQNGWSLEFEDKNNAFVFLTEGEELVFKIKIRVDDGEFTATGEYTLTCTVTGKGTLHEVTVGNPDLEIWANDQNVTTKHFSPDYQITESDEGEGHYYELVDIDPELAACVSINETSGEITIDREKLPALLADTDFTLTVKIVGDIDGLFTTVDLTLRVKVAKEPVVTDIVDTITETGESKIDISVTPPEDGAPRDKDWYAITPASTDVPPGVTGYTVEIVDDKFVFKPNGAFAYLGAGESATLTFTFDVTDNRYGTTSVLKVTITVDGENAQPEGKKDLPVFTGGTYGDGAIKIGEVADLVDDADVNDSHTLLMIDGVDVTGGGWVAVGGRGQFMVENGTLWYKPQVPEGATSNELEAIRHNVLETFTFTFTVQDDSLASNATGTGTLKIDVKGVNSAPVLIDGRAVLEALKEGKTRTYKASDFATDKNTGDTLKFHMIAGVDLSANPDITSITLADGTIIHVDADRTKITIDATKRKRNMLDGEKESISFEIVVKDDSGATNDKTGKELILLTIQGVNDAPVMPSQNFGVSLHDNPKNSVVVGTIDLTDADTPKEDYSFKIVDGSVVLKDSTVGVTPPAKTPSFYIDDDGTIQLLSPEKLPSLTGSQQLVYTLDVLAWTEAGESVQTTFTVTIKNKQKPIVTVDTGNTEITDAPGEKAGIGLTVKDPYGERADSDMPGDPWFKYTNVRFVDYSVSGRNGEMDGSTTLPYGAEFGITDNLFHFGPNGTFDFLGQGDTATLTFEFTVRDLENGVDTITRITIVVQGTNSKPVAKGSETVPKFWMGSDTATHKFYLSELASDADRYDKLSFATVNGDSLDLNESVDVMDGEFLVGTITRLSDENGEYLLFQLNTAYTNVRHNLTKSFGFTYTVTDGEEDSGEAGVHFDVIGVNKTPEIIVNEVGTDEKTPIDITPSAIAKDPNGDAMHIVGVKVGGQTYMIDPAADVRIALDSGAVLLLRKDGTLHFDPTGRTTNLKADKKAYEMIYIIVEDDSAQETSRTEWETLFIKVVGVNDPPQDLIPDDNTRLGTPGATITIDLKEHFADPDLNFSELTIQFEQGGKSLGQSGFIKSCTITTGSKLVIELDSAYANETNFSPQSFTLVVSDGSDSITKTFTIGLEPTIRFDILTPDGNGVQVGDRYEIQVQAKDLINEQLKKTFGYGIYNASFNLYFNPNMCEIGEIFVPEGVSYTYMPGSGCIHITVDGSKLANDLFDLSILRFGVTAVGQGGIVKFWVADAHATRSDGYTTVDASQIFLGVLEVAHASPTYSPQNSMIVGFSARSVSDAFTTLTTTMGFWTAEEELLYGDQEPNESNSALEIVMGDTDFLDETGYSAGLMPESNGHFAADRLLDGEMEDALTDHLLNV